MREAVQQYLDNGLSRRGFLKRMTALGFTAAGAEAVLKPLQASEQADPLDVPGATWVEGIGAQLLIGQAKAAGTRFLFANPGSAETGFYDGFVDTPGMQIIEGLHEGVVCSMADGYNRLSGQPALINVHVMPGTATLAGQLYNASRDGCALIVTAGLRDNELWNDDGPLAPRPGFNQKEVNRQFTKISWEARDGSTLAVLLRRAYKVAVSEPGGPTYLAITSEALSAKGIRGQVLPGERFLIRGPIRADEDAVEKVAQMLLDARRPVLVAGDEVFRSRAQAELLALSEELGIAAISASRDAYRSFPTQHPHWIGSLGGDFGKETDLILFVGSRDMGGRGLPDRPSPDFGVPIVRIGVDTAAMGNTYGTDLALVADVKETLTDILDAVRSMATKERIAALAKPRSDAASAISMPRLAEMKAEYQGNVGRSPIHPDEVGIAMAETLDPDAILVHENFTGRNDMFRFGFRDDEILFLTASAGSLGWGIGASTGVKLGAPDRQVVCSIGDGAVMYSASGFWTQARYSVPVLTVVWNNRNYQVVRRGFARFGGRMTASGHYPGMYLGDPDIDYVKLAESQGVSGERVETGADLVPALKRGIAATRAGDPYLVEVLVARYGDGAESTWYQKYSLADERKRQV